MAFVTTKFDGAVSHKISHNDNVTNTASKNVVDGAGVLYSVKIANTNDAAVFVKIANAHTATAGTTAPDWIFSCPAASTYFFEIPGGIAFEALSCWATENATPADNTTPSVSGNEKIAVTIVTGF